MQKLIMISDPQGKQRLIEQANIYISIQTSQEALNLAQRERHKIFSCHIIKTVVQC